MKIVPEILGISGIFFMLFFPLSLFSHSQKNKESVADIIMRAEKRELWKEKQWLNLGHYQRHFKSYKSQADGAGFFLAGQEGIKNPRAELVATLQGFAQTSSGNHRDHPQCRFPARYLWLESQLHWVRNIFPQVKCDAFEAFKKKEDAGSATLVFSSYYLNNPSSAYGHTLLRLNKVRSSHAHHRSDLLDHGINYSAAMTTQNPIAYAIMGLGGMFRGVFTNVPYFYKVREYNDFESRDLWEYDLSLTPDEIKMLVAHLWELGSTYFDYYYLTENCSYHMLTALEAAAPRYELTQKLSYYVIPSDTIKVVYETPGLVSRINYRPSVRAQFEFRLNQLSRDEKKEVWKLLKNDDFSGGPLLEEQKAVILDTAIDYFDLKHGKKLLKNDPELSAFKQKLLLARSQIVGTGSALEIQPPRWEAPQEGHGSARTGLISSYSNQTGPYVTLTHRFALHDLLDPQRGYPDYMEIDFIKFDLRYNPRDHHLWPENVDLINIFSLSDFSQFQRSLTWKLRTGATIFRDEACANCTGGFLEGGVGFTHSLGHSPWVATLTLDAEISGSPKFEGLDARLRLGPMAQLRATFWPNLQMIFRSQYRQSTVPDYASNTESKAELRWEFLKNIAFDAQVKHFWHPQFWEAGAGLYFYH